MAGANDGSRTRLKIKIVRKFLRQDVIDGSSETVEAAQHWFVEDEQVDVREILDRQARSGDEEFPIEGERSAGVTTVYIPSDRVSEAFEYAKSNTGVFSGGMDDSSDDEEEDGS